MAGTGGTIEKRHRMVFECAQFEPIPARTERGKATRGEVFEVVLIYKMMGVSLLSQTAVMPIVWWELVFSFCMIMNWA
jgi:hypothetical protein